MINKKLFFISIFATALTACSSVESDLKSFMKCGMAANQLERNFASREIADKMDKYIRKNKVNGSARNAMYLGQEVRDDLNLHSKSLDGQIYSLVKIYNSSECRDMHEQEKIKMPFMYYLVYFFM